MCKSMCVLSKNGVCHASVRADHDGRISGILKVVSAMQVWEQRSNCAMLALESALSVHCPKQTGGARSTWQCVVPFF
jgi:hypothetical protein